MTISEFKRWLKAQGCTFEEGARHTIVRLDGKTTTLPRHPAKELKAGTRLGILKALGLTDATRK